MKTVSNPKLLENPDTIDPILTTDSWSTLMTFTRESARMSFLQSLIGRIAHH